MGTPDELTLPEDCAITEREAVVVDWVLANGALEESLDHLRPSIRDLRVVARCACGCASVDFVPHGQSVAARPVAEAAARDSRGRECGVIVWGTASSVEHIDIGVRANSCAVGDGDIFPYVDEIFNVYIFADLGAFINRNVLGNAGFKLSGRMKQSKNLAPS